MPDDNASPDPARSPRVTLFLAGDVMLGRGVDQVFARSCDPGLHEPYVRSAHTYVELAENAHGPIPAPVEPGYVWGELPGELERSSPAARIVNLETALTTHDAWDRGKGIHYRAHPDNVRALEAVGADCAVLANNHVLDWGEDGLLETLRTLAGAGIPGPGAGRSLQEARAPAVLDLDEGGRVLVFGLGVTDAGIPGRWAATADGPGVHLLADLSAGAVDRFAELVERHRHPGDLVVASIHWGGNWGYRIPRSHRRFARGLVERSGVDLVHGHSSHHPRAGEVHRDRLILYGCGDFLNDYEGIRGHESYRGDLVLAYLPTLDADDGRLVGLEMVPFRIRRLRLERPAAGELEWLRGRLDREWGKLGAGVVLNDAGRLGLA